MRPSVLNLPGAVAPRPLTQTPKKFWLLLLLATLTFVLRVCVRAFFLYRVLVPLSPPPTLQLGFPQMLEQSMKTAASVDDAKLVMNAQRLFAVKGYDAEKATRDVRRLELRGEIMVRPGKAGSHFPAP